MGIMKTIKINEDDYCKLRAITKAYGIYTGRKQTIQDTLNRLIGYEWENPAYATSCDEENETPNEKKALKVHREEYLRLKNLK